MSGTPQPENLHLQELRKYADEDQEYQDLKQLITTSFPNQKSSLPASQKKFWGVKDHLTIDDNLIVHGCRLFIPANFMKGIKESLSLRQELDSHFTGQESTVILRTMFTDVVIARIIYHPKARSL